ncbi:MAG: cytochrome c [Candidatus Brocadia sp.]
MKKAGLKRITASCLFVVAAAVGMSYAWRGSIISAKDIESKHTAEPTPTRSLMRVISSHTSRILEAIMDGDHEAVIKESNAVAESSQEIMKNFFPEGGQVGEWFKETGKDAKNPEDVKAVKKDFEKYMKTVADAAKNIAETSKKQNIVETYKSLDAMLKNACFTCHEAARPKWPEWPEWMKITGG